MPRRTSSASKSSSSSAAAKAPASAGRGLAGATPDRFLQLLRRGSDLRRDKVRRLRRAIRAGTYDNDLKLDVALDRLLGDA